jgi:RimJ/RimL family protein N-acetyltransferase
MAIDIKPVRLVGQHVILEPLAEAHAKGLFKIGQDAEDWRYLPIPGFQDMAHAEEWVSEAIKLTEDGQQLAFAQLDPKMLTPIGSTRYMNIRRRDHGFEIGYTFIARAYQRTAVNTESKYLLLQHAFETLGVIRVEFKTDARNLRSQKAIERIGATREGVFRKHMIVQNGYVRDSVYYSIVVDEWPRIKADLLNKLAARNGHSA